MHSGAQLPLHLQASSQDATHWQKAILIMLLGGAPGCVKLDDWDFVKDDGVHYASDEDDSDADVDESSDPEGESDAQDRCCYAVARFLNAVRLQRFLLDKPLPKSGN